MRGGADGVVCLYSCLQFLPTLQTCFSLSIFSKINGKIASPCYFLNAVDVAFVGKTIAQLSRIKGHPTPLTLEPRALIANPSYLLLLVRRRRRSRNNGKTGKS